MQFQFESPEGVGTVYDAVNGVPGALARAEDGTLKTAVASEKAMSAVRTDLFTMFTPPGAAEKGESVAANRLLSAEIRHQYPVLVFGQELRQT